MARAVSQEKAGALLTSTAVNTLPAINGTLDIFRIFIFASQ